MSQPQGNVGYPAPIATTTTATAYTPMSTVAVTNSDNSGPSQIPNSTAIGIAVGVVAGVFLLIFLVFQVRKFQRKSARGDALSKLDGSAPVEQPSIRFSEMFPRHSTEKGFSQLRESNGAQSPKAPRSSSRPRRSTTRKSSNLNPATNAAHADAEKHASDDYEGVDW